MGDFVKAVVNAGKSLVGSAESLIGIKKAPTASTQPVTDLTADQSSANQGRAALYGTQGGGAGEQLTPDQIKQRQTLFGN